VNLPTVLDEIGSRWELEWKPWLVQRVRAGRVADYGNLTNAEFDAELHRQIDYMTEQWTIHGHINFGTVAALRFIDFYQGPSHRTTRPRPTSSCRIRDRHDANE
jgi:hypothetical protein